MVHDDGVSALTTLGAGRIDYQKGQFPNSDKVTSLCVLNLLEGVSGGELDICASATGTK